MSYSTGFLAGDERIELFPYLPYKPCIYAGLSAFFIVKSVITFAVF